MPLPTNTNLSLLGYSRPEDALHSKPKQAILVRMSSETLDALESLSQPQVFFEFGQHPGIYIGDTHFPMRYSQESAIHELFLRTSSATKKTAPLKLHANVMGKFTVERELADELRDKIRESTQDAANQRNTRTTVFIENPPELQPNIKKKKEGPSMFRKPLRPADKPKASAPMPSSAPSRNPSSSMQTQKSLEPLRARLIQYLALSERTEEQVLQNVSGTEFNSFSSRDVRDILDNLAEATSVKSHSTDKSLRVYRLKSASWREVRPYEWPGLTESQRTALARSARIALQNLGIPESDSVWAHVRYRSPTTGNVQKGPSQPDSSSNFAEKVASSKMEAKRSLTSREAKEKVTKVAADKRKGITMKDESMKATSHVSHQDGPISSLRRPPSADSASLHDASHIRNQSSQAPKPRKANTSQNRAASPVIVSRSIRQVDNANSPSSSLNSSSLGHGEERYNNKARKTRPEEKTRSLDPSMETTREKQRAHIEKRRGNEVAQYDDIRQQSLKRKVIEKTLDDGYNAAPQSLQKKRKTDHTLSSTPGRQDEKEVDVSVHRKQNLASSTSDRSKGVSNSSSTKTSSINNSLPPRPTTATSSTLPNPRSLSSNASSSSSNKNNALAKPRRRSPIYTSSEEEGPQPIRDVASRALPTDRASLRARYNSTYLQYLATFQRLLVQRAKLDSLLKSTDLTTSGTITESDGDSELLDCEELARLTKDHKHLEEELESIQKTFSEGA